MNSRSRYSPDAPAFVRRLIENICSGERTPLGAGWDVGLYHRSVDLGVEYEDLHELTDRDVAKGKLGRVWTMLFPDPEHPATALFTRIPVRHRLAFLQGLVAGIRGVDLPELAQD